MIPVQAFRTFRGPSNIPPAKMAALKIKAAIPLARVIRLPNGGFVFHRRTA